MYGWMKETSEELTSEWVPVWVEAASSCQNYVNIINKNFSEGKAIKIRSSAFAWRECIWICNKNPMRMNVEWKQKPTYLFSLQVFCISSLLWKISKLIILTMGQIHLTFLHLQVVDYMILIIQHYPLPNTFLRWWHLNFACFSIYLPFLIPFIQWERLDLGPLV